MSTPVAAARPRREESEPLVWLTVAVALLIGLAVAAVVLGRTTRVEAGGMSLSYPAAWVPVASPDVDFAALDLRGGGIFGARVSMRSIPRGDIVSGPSSVTGAVRSWALQRGNDLVAYRILDMVPRTVGGREAVSLEYAYVLGGPLGSASNSMPALMRAVDTVVESRERYYVLTFAAEAGDYEHLTRGRFPRFRNELEALLDGWRVP
jgi:hypothetical protein